MKCIDLRRDSSFQPETSSELSKLKTGVSGRPFINYCLLIIYNKSLSNIDWFIELTPKLDSMTTRVRQIRDQVDGIIYQALPIDAIKSS